MTRVRIFCTTLFTNNNINFIIQIHAFLMDHVDSTSILKDKFKYYFFIKRVANVKLPPIVPPLPKSPVPTLILHWLKNSGQLQPNIIYLQKNLHFLTNYRALALFDEVSNLVYIIHNAKVLALSIKKERINIHFEFGLVQYKVLNIFISRMFKSRCEIT